MTRFKLANILLEDMRQFHEAPKLFCHSSSSLLPQDADGVAHLVGSGSFDYLTYFNGLNVAKWRTYTTADNFHLHLELRGAATTLIQNHANSYDFYSNDIPNTEMQLPASQEWVEYDIDLITDSYDVMVGFRLETTGDVFLRNCYFFTETEQSKIRPVELAVSTTTFRKERFITHNIDLVKKHVLGSSDPIANHFRMYVIDNGKTLDAETLSNGIVQVYPNDNVGGAGGFAYGMLLAQEQDDVTHILLMDDDVEMSPESFIRTFNILSLVNEEYKDAFLSGSMMDFDNPDSRWEDIGYMTAEGICRAVKPKRNMSVLHDIVDDEMYVADYKSRPDLSQMYAAWWYCCIPLTQIRKHGMPLPIFVRYDDIEYGQRCAPKIMTMSGICVWHLAFDLRYSEGVERYQTSRNGLITQYTTGVSSMSNFLVEITHSIRLELIKFNYAGAELLLRGLEDFMKGPDYIAQRGVAEKTFMNANRDKERLLPLEEIRDEAFSLTGRDILALNHNEIFDDIPYTGTHHGTVFDMGYRQVLKNTLNGQLWGKIIPARGNTAIIEAYGWVYPVGKIAGVDHIVAIDVPNKKGVIRHRDNERCKDIWKRFNRTVKTLKKEDGRLHAEYAAARNWLTSVPFWYDYLGLNDR